MENWKQVQQFHQATESPQLTLWKIPFDCQQIASGNFVEKNVKFLAIFWQFSNPYLKKHTFLRFHLKHQLHMTIFTKCVLEINILVKRFQWYLWLTESFHQIEAKVLPLFWDWLQSTVKYSNIWLCTFNITCILDKLPTVCSPILIISTM